MIRATGSLLLLAALAGAAADPPQVGDFTLALADGTTAPGPLEELGDGWSMRLGGATPRRVAGSEILTLRRAATPRPAFPAGEQVIFANGDRLPGRVVKLAGERLRFRADIGTDQELLLP